MILASQKPPKILPKRLQNRNFVEKADFVKMCTTLKRKPVFSGSEPPENPPKRGPNEEKIDSKNDALSDINFFTVWLRF